MTGSTHPLTSVSPALAAPTTPTVPAAAGVPTVSVALGAPTVPAPPDAPTARLPDRGTVLGVGGGLPTPTPKSPVSSLLASRADGVPTCFTGVPARFAGVPTCFAGVPTCFAGVPTCFANPAARLSGEGDDDGDSLGEVSVDSVESVAMVFLPVCSLAIPTKRREEPPPVCRMKPMRRESGLATRLAGVSNSPTLNFDCFCFAMKRRERRGYDQAANMSRASFSSRMQ